MRILFVIVFVSLLIGSFLSSVPAHAWGQSKDKKVAEVKPAAALEPAAPAVAPETAAVSVVAQPPQPGQEPAPGMEGPLVNPITQAAVQSGVLACTSRVNQVSSFLAGPNVSGAYLFTTKDQPDHHIFSTSMEVRPADKPAFYASASFGPNPDGGCDASYDTVEYSEKTCAALGKESFKGGEPVVLKKDIYIYNTGAVKFFLMPAGKGCIVIRKELVQ